MDDTPSTKKVVNVSLLTPITRTDSDNCLSSTGSVRRSLPLGEGKSRDEIESDYLLSPEIPPPYLPLYN